MDSDGNSSLTDIDGSVTRSCREADKESPRQGAKALLMDGIGCQKCFCVTFGKVTKLMKEKQIPWSLNSIGAFAGEEMFKDQEYISRTRELMRRIRR